MHVDALKKMEEQICNMTSLRLETSRIKASLRDMTKHVQETIKFSKSKGKDLPPFWDLPQLTPYDRQFRDMCAYCHATDSEMQQLVYLKCGHGFCYPCLGVDHTVTRTNHRRQVCCVCRSDWHIEDVKSQPTHDEWQSQFVMEMSSFYLSSMVSEDHVSNESKVRGCQDWIQTRMVETRREEKQLMVIVSQCHETLRALECQLPIQFVSEDQEGLALEPGNHILSFMWPLSDANWNTIKTQGHNIDLVVLDVSPQLCKWLVELESNFTFLDTHHIVKIHVLTMDNSVESHLWSSVQNRSFFLPQHNWKSWTSIYVGEEKKKKATASGDKNTRKRKACETFASRKIKRKE
jgi:hypothetical protein